MIHKTPLLRILSKGHLVPMKGFMCANERIHVSICLISLSLSIPDIYLNLDILAMIYSKPPNLFHLISQKWDLQIQIFFRSSLFVLSAPGNLATAAEAGAILERRGIRHPHLVNTRFDMPTLRETNSSSP